MFSLIVAFDDHKGIGKDNKLPWYFKEDLKLFKENTINKKIVMGRNTFDSIGKPLPLRHTFIVSNQIKENKENITYINDFDHFLKTNKDSKEEIMICGGASIYALALPYCTKLYISKVEGNYNCDTFFPNFNENKFKIVFHKKYCGFTFYEYEKCYN